MQLENHRFITIIVKIDSDKTHQWMLYLRESFNQIFTVLVYCSTSYLSITQRKSSSYALRNQINQKSKTNSTN